MSAPTRVPAGVPTGGQFAGLARRESAVLLAHDAVPPGIDDLDLPAWDAPADTADPRGAFSRCKEVSAEYTEHLRAHAIDAQWVQVCGPRGSFPDAQPQWRGISQVFWQHYVTRVPHPDGDLYVDFTARQFDPTADHPQVTRVADAAWDETYRLNPSVLDQYLASWRHEQQAARPDPLPAGRLRIDDYFDGGVADYVRTPWIQADLHITLVPDDWRRMPIAEIPVTGLKRTQSRLIKDRVRHHLAAQAEPDGGDLPWVVRYRGEYWVVDGHHRFVGAQFRDEETQKAHLIDLTDR